MKSSRFISAVLIALAGLTSCDNFIDELCVSAVEMVEFNVTAKAEVPVTKVELGSDNKVLWQEDDNIGILSKSYYDCLTIASGAGTTTASFSGEVHDTDEDRIAVFPYIDSKNTRYDGDEGPYVTLAWEENNIGSSTQVAVKGGFMPSESLMAGRIAADRSVAFKNLLAFVKFSIDFSCNAVSLVANGDEYIAAGAVKFRFDDNGVPTDISGQYTPSTSIRLTGMNGEDLTPGTYYIGVLPETLEDGFTLLFEMPDGEGECLKGTSKAVQFKRSVILNLGVISKTDMDVFASGAAFKGSGTNDDPYVINCLNTGDILATGRPGCAGGLLGKCYDSDTKVYCCVNTGEIYGINDGMPATIISDYAEYRHLGALCGSDGGYYYYCVWTNNNNQLPVVFNSADYSHMVSSAYSTEARASVMNANRSNIPNGIVSSYCTWSDSTLYHGFDLVITR